MARTQGTLKLSSNIEPLAAAPLDARSKVSTLAELTASGTFPYPYAGMEVYVASEQKKFLLIGDDPTVETNWIEGGSGGQVNAIAIEDLTDVAHLTDGFYYNLSDTKVYEVINDIATESSKKIEICEIDYELYQANQIALDLLDILFVINNAPSGGAAAASSDGI